MTHAAKRTWKRRLMLAFIVWVALAMVPPASQAKNGGGGMSDDEIAMLSCGHLGVPCPAHQVHVKGARAHHARHRAGHRRRTASATRRCH